MALEEHPDTFKKLSPLAKAECDIQLYASQYGLNPSIGTSIATLLTDTWMLSSDSGERHQQISNGLRRLLGEQLALNELMKSSDSPDQVQHAARFLKYLEGVHMASDVAREFITQLLRIAEKSQESPPA